MELNSSLDQATKCEFTRRSFGTERNDFPLRQTNEGCYDHDVLGQAEGTAVTQ